MSSGMTGQTPCLTSRWDQAAQPNARVPAHPPSSSRSIPSHGSLSGVHSSTVSQSLQKKDSGVADGSEKVPSQGGVEVAAAMAAKLNAMLMAKGKLLTPQPLLTKASPRAPTLPIPDEIAVAEVDINDVPINCRDLLTKGKTQEEIRLLSGAVVSTKGHYMTDVEKQQSAGQKPLYLHVQGKTQEQVNRAVGRIKEVISEEVTKASAALGQQMPVIPPITIYPQAPRPMNPAGVPNANQTVIQGHRPAAPHVGSFVHTKVFVGLDHALPTFNIKEKIEGPAGRYLGHIQSETGARVFLRGKGSGYIEQASKRESFEPLYIYISHPNAAGLEEAKTLTESLLATVKSEYAKMSTYTSPSSTQTYAAAHGYPPNSNYSCQGSWYSYPANGYSDGYSAYPGASGYWGNATTPPSQSDTPTNPPPAQAMVQYPMCPKNAQSYLDQNQGSNGVAKRQETPDSATGVEHSKTKVQEELKQQQPPASCPEEPRRPQSAGRVEKVVERILMPPPPPVFAVSRKRPKEVVKETRVSPPQGASEIFKKPKVLDDSSGLVPYGEDSSDEEEEKTCSSKTSCS
ncbi:KH homology domain-containing protein 4-like [Synchiropus splendidus]|uniref:KH homology domain-containing protein 4-like n=1 Tax=Synchiropus splendidus TaxID=270530 RepID=UPI00237E8F03|nr:KH homology domain-containing protein 4-like [Synchiropus splendidus]